jgi:FMN phosphatase YigB (HAD superfamily)
VLAEVTTLESAVLGIRKPSLDIFEYTLKTIGCQADEVGSNLKAASKMGIRCIRVPIGKEGEAVKELERNMGMKLSDEKARI